MFSIYMVDVLCCALGCVILLWQLYNLESEEQHSAAQSALAQLSNANLAISSLTSEVDGLKVSLDASKKETVRVTLELADTRNDRDKLQQLALVRKKEYDALKEMFNASQASVANLNVDLKDLQQKETLTAKELSAKLKAYADLSTRLQILEKELGVKEADLKSAAARADQHKIDYKTADERARKLQEQLAKLERDRVAQMNTAEAQAHKLEDELAKLNKDHQIQLTLSEAQARRLEDQLTKLAALERDDLAKLKLNEAQRLALAEELGRTKQQVSDAGKRIQDLLQLQGNLNQKYETTLKDLSTARGMLGNMDAQIRAARSAADTRFAGLTLTGERIVFLIDMSGSMVLVDETTAAPDKWPELCETLGKLMGSLPELKQYQVVLFSNKVSYLMGNDGHWLDFDPANSVKATVQALKAVKPRGETDMSSALNEAFKFRQQGLDTVYIFSDGLPNNAPGLPPEFTRLTEQQKTDFLAKQIRQRLKTVWNRPVEGQRVRINTIGFFFESPDVGAFLWAMARENDGSFVGMSRP